MSFPAYPNYAETDIVWCSQLPSHWTTRRLKTLFQLMKRPPEEGDKIVTAFRDGQVTLRERRREEGFTNALQEIGYQRVLAGDLVIHAMDGFAGAIGVSDADGKSTPVYSVCTPALYADAHYFALLLRHMALSGFVTALAKGVRERSTDFRWSDASVLDLPCPPLSEQRAIVSFLDRETAKIDALVEEQRRLIELLKEKRQAVISHAVTKGLDPAVPMKNSGVEWLGDVPAHWEVGQARRLISAIEQGWSPECESRAAEGGEWGVLKTGCVNGGVFRPSENKALPITLQPMPEYEIRPGDVLVSRANGTPELVGSTAYVLETPERLMLSDKIFRLHVQSRVDQRWLSALFNSYPIRVQIIQAISGAGGLANNLPQANLKTFVCPLPPLEEQRDIERYIDLHTSRFDKLIDKAAEAIALFRERRAALISAAVTGKIDVRGAVPHEVEAA